MLAHEADWKAPEVCVEIRNSMALDRLDSERARIGPATNLRRVRLQPKMDGYQIEFLRRKPLERALSMQEE
jgi:hypothetical protein